MLHHEDYNLPLRLERSWLDTIYRLVENPRPGTRITLPEFEACLHEWNVGEVVLWLEGWGFPLLSYQVGYEGLRTLRNALAPYKLDELERTADADFEELCKAPAAACYFRNSTETFSGMMPVNRKSLP